MKQCNNCGADVPNGAKFCSNCGKPVFDNQTNSEQESSTSRQSASLLDSASVDDEKQVQEQEYETETVIASDYIPENNGGAKERSGISVLAIVMCSIAVAMLIALATLLIVRNCKPKYRIVYPEKTSQLSKQSSNSLQYEWV